MSTDWDVAVVGAGIAGLTAARVAAEHGLRVVAYDRLTPGGQLVDLTALHEHPGGTGPELVAALTAAAEGAGVRLAYAEVTRVHPGSPARLEISDGEVTAGVVVVAAGLAVQAAALNAHPDPSFLDVAAAKAAAGEAATIAARTSHQAHGAIGMTKEYELGQLSRRLWSWRDEFGSERYWSRELGWQLAADGADALWPRISTGLVDA